MSLESSQQRNDRLRGAPFEAQRNESSIFGTIIQVYPETYSCRVKDDGGGFYDTLPFPGLIQDAQGSGGSVRVPRPGQRVELAVNGELGTRIRGYVPMPTPALCPETSTPPLFPEGLPASQQGRVSYRGLMPKDLVPGDWSQIGNQGQYVGMFDGGVASIFGSPWAHINAIGGTNIDTVNLVARRLNLLTGFGDLKFKSENGRHAIEFYGGLDQMTETGSTQNKWTYRGGLGTQEGYSFFSVTSKSGDPIYRVNVGYDGGHRTFCAGSHTLTTLSNVGISVGGNHTRMVEKNDYVEVQSGDRVEVFKRNRECRINVNDTLQVMGNVTQSIQGTRVVTCQTLDHNVSGKMTSKPGDTAYGLKVANGSWDIDIGKPPTDFAKSLSSFNLNVWSPKGSINLGSKLGDITLKSTLATSIKAITTLDMEATVKATLKSAMIAFEAKANLEAKASMIKIAATGVTEINGSMIRIGGPSASQVAIKGTKFLADMGSFLGQLSSAAAGSGTPPGNAACIARISAAAGQLSAKLGSWASMKVFVT